jgi:SAM-dependent methyltransferase
MKQSTVQRLIELNSEFYQTFATFFSATRMRLQPGVGTVLEKIPLDANILDLGCGNGELAGALVQRGHQGWYLGLDFSSELIGIAREKLAARTNFIFIRGDLASSGWREQVCGTAGAQIGISGFDLVFCFAAFHHLPGRDLHVRTLGNIRSLLEPDGYFIHSNWQFLKSERLRKRIQPWDEIALTLEDVDPGDYLLDWRQGGRGLRYVHHFDEAELVALAVETGFNVVESFYSDGEGGNLGLYQLWEPAVHPPD